VRYGATFLTGSGARGFSVRAAVVHCQRWGARALLVLALLVGGCRPDAPTESDLPPDRRLQSELGLDPLDRVHQVVLYGGAEARAEPAELLLAPGEYVQFLTADSWIHEIRFDVPTMSAEAVAFMAGLDQLSSPPLVSRGSRFVLSFVGAPAGRYPYTVEGNGPATFGALVIEVPAGR